MVIEELVKAVLGELKNITKTETVVGKPIEMGETTIVPVSRISVGFGVGGAKRGGKEGSGEATGGGMTIEPVAFFVSRKEKVELITVKKESTGLGQVIDLVPEIIDKVKTMTGKKESESGGEKTGRKGKKD